MKAMRAGAVVGALAVVFSALVGAHAAGAAVAGAAGMARIAAGEYRPLYRQPVPGTNRDTILRRVVPVRVAAFELDRHAVTNGEFLAFVREHPEWRRSRISRLWADEGYLKRWAGDLDPGPRAPLDAPVVEVSWFAARAWCEAQGKRLPTVAEWERAGNADETRRDASRDPKFLDRIRKFYSHPTPDVHPRVESTFRNAWGVWDLHGLVWEWTLDFNSALVSGESRGDSSLERGLYCGAGASNAGDFGDYAAFMRFAFRASLQARYTTANLGFRAARDVAATGGKKP
ncbi:MAG: formylglycine-generating enzyme family protein [Candidatus Eisenbacteria bacterium]|uniref:Formylglycine-generating enzyme family protein n=1 Tax=Eiseniibacteriota bacterium TaxID=2212470 RepID=A0A933W223_UNCEI|nr:formylglycine-generating enzyme family protein [Candidatus Eisenbacteria bacterium]